MRFGRTVPKGFLPVYSVDTEEQAEQLLTAACQTNIDGDFVAEELARDQKVETLVGFSDKLHSVYGIMVERGMVEELSND